MPSAACCLKNWHWLTSQFLGPYKVRRSVILSSYLLKLASPLQRQLLIQIRPIYGPDVFVSFKQHIEKIVLTPEDSAFSYLLRSQA